MARSVTANKRDSILASEDDNDTTHMMHTPRQGIRVTRVQFRVNNLGFISRKASFQGV